MHPMTINSSGMISMRLGALLLALAGCASAPLPSPLMTTGYPRELCHACPGWNATQTPFQIYGNTYFVGTRGLSVILIASPQGHILLDGGLPDTAPKVLENIAALGFDIADIRLILNSHAHYDHAGGIAALQLASGARVAASPESAPVLEAGQSGPEDPQYGVLFDYHPVENIEVFADGETLTVGNLAVTAHITGGHSPGGTSWSWRGCEGESCLDIVLADSQTAASADGFLFSRNEGYPTVLADFERSFELLESIPCDLLITPHPAASSFWERRQSEIGFVDREACRRYAATARAQLARRLATEAAQP
jgi:metallo-beta-lactamase class B